MGIVSKSGGDNVLATMPKKKTDDRAKLTDRETIRLGERSADSPRHGLTAEEPQGSRDPVADVSG